MANGIYANLTNEEYWIKRSEERVSKHWKNELNVEKRLAKEYQLAASDIKKEISDLYIKYALDNNLSYTDAIKAMTSFEIQDYKNAIEQMTQRVKLVNPNAPILADMERLASTAELTRLQAKVNQIEARLLELGVTEQLTLEDSLSNLYEANYYQTVYEVQSGVGLGLSFNKLNEQAILSAITMPWSGDMFSDRIWDNKKLLVKNLRQTITQGLIRGEGYSKMAKALDGTMNAGYKNSLRLVRTETANVMAQSTALGYEEGGFVSSYIIIATLDNRTSSVCQRLDNKVYLLKDKQLGVNFPPLHPNCRTFVSVYFGEDELKDVTRIARGEDGKNYKVPASMNYQEWYDSYVKNKATQ